MSVPVGGACQQGEKEVAGGGLKRSGGDEGDIVVVVRESDAQPQQLLRVCVCVCVSE